MNKEIEAQLMDRRRNLAVVLETIEKDPLAGQKLIPVRDFLIKRIGQLEREENSAQMVTA